MKGKIVLITGCNTGASLSALVPALPRSSVNFVSTLVTCDSGIGKETARVFAVQGATV